MEQRKLRESIWQRVVLDLNNQSQIQVHCALLSPPITYWPLQSPKTTSLYICDCVSVTLKINHTHCCHATLAAHKTHRYNWLHCTLYPLWTGQLANENNSAVTGREPNPWPCLSDNQAWQIISKKMGKKRRQKDCFSQTGKKSGMKRDEVKQNIVHCLLWEAKGDDSVSVGWWQTSRWQHTYHHPTQTHRKVWLERGSVVSQRPQWGSQPCHYPNQQSRGSPEPGIPRLARESRAFVWGNCPMRER